MVGRPQGEVGFQHSSTEVEHGCCLLADDILRNKDHTVIYKEGAHCNEGGKKKKEPTQASPSLRFGVQ